MNSRITAKRRKDAVLRPMEPVIGARTARVVSDAPKWVLVVDDEPDVLDSVADYVARMPHAPRIEVRTARSGAEAIEIMDRHSFDLIITDFGLGSMDGVRFLEIARQMVPDVPCVMMSGNPTGALERLDELQAENLVFLQKPFDPAELESHAMDALGSPPNLQTSSHPVSHRRPQAETA